MLPSHQLHNSFYGDHGHFSVRWQFLRVLPLELLSGKEKRRKRLMGGWMWTHVYWRDRGRKRADSCQEEVRCQAFSSSLSYTVAHSKHRQKQKSGKQIVAVSKLQETPFAKYKETGCLLFACLLACFFPISSLKAKAAVSCRQQESVFDGKYSCKSCCEKFTKGGFKWDSHQRWSQCSTPSPNLSPSCVPFSFLLHVHCDLKFSRSCYSHMNLTPPTSCCAPCHRDAWALQNE